MSIEFKEQPNEGECCVFVCTKSKAKGDRMVLHHKYETNKQEKEKYKSRIKTSISRLKPSQNKETQERNEEERSLCTWLRTLHHSKVHAAFSK